MVQTATRAWYQALDNTLYHGRKVAPRGQSTRELPQATYELDLRKCVVDCPPRALNYRFAAAEALWILSGSNRVDGVAPWNKKMADFSDDGVTLFGAYGPRIQSQLSYVVAKLQEDPDTRQAGLTIWREYPPKTKDTPCTVAMWFQLRDGKLNQHVFMRSNDLWLGFPYDVFSFSMVAHQVCCRLNRELCETHQTATAPGTLYLTAASSHLYEQNFGPAKLCLDHVSSADQVPAPADLHLDETKLIELLRHIRDDRTTTEWRWWERSLP